MTGFPHVTCFFDRHGHVRYRYRRKGRPTVYLPGKPGEPDFAAAYAAAADGEARIEIGAGRTKPGTINALAVMVYGSAEWSLLSSQTQVTYRGIIERLRKAYGDQTVAGLKKEHVLKMRDMKRDAPTAANNMVKVLRWILNLAVDRNWRSDNPCIGIKPLKVESEGWHTWTEAEVQQFEKRWPIGTRERLALDLLLYTVQRSWDVRHMGRQTEQAGRLDLTQHKTGAEMSLPIHPSLAASLAAVPKTQMLYLPTQAGPPFSAKGFSNWFSDAARKAGLTGCTAHGLRKTGATRIADGGYSEATIMAWTGHKTTKEVQRYTRRRDQKRLADSVLAGTDGEQDLANLRDRVAK